MDIQVFRRIFPAFVGEAFPDEMIETWGNLAKSYLSESWLLNGERFSLALNLMTAHLLFSVSQSTKSNNGASGTVQSASQGSVSVSFSTPTTKNGWEFWLSTSPYGVQLWALLNSVGAVGCFIGGLPERQAVRKVGGVFV
ncbi:uncharacterized protein DUF4054 [Volucribacter psittacicida]|uniref:Uncharacterized protein DUF4054 n=1 Tax=Volucribacter psittacicida TaxID=203482 RepID=A0A4R1FRQ8_9PAST|nr:DUF4054 domain-containing protein [Volucribacter psittacicida]TCJ96149.1 uncharacterized protein DUF4054 [Volucribacter psittacicida]